MAKLSIAKGATSVLVRIFIQDSSSSTGAGLTGLAYNTSGLVCYRMRDDDGNAGATAITLATATLGTWTSGGFKEKDATNAPGWYEFGIPNAALATGSRSVDFHFKGATNMAPLPVEIELTGFDNQSTTDGGLSKLMSLTFTVSNKIDANIYTWNGTAVSTPATAGIPEVNVKNINNVSASSVTTINANQGTTQPVNFTGTSGSALVKSDMVDVAGAAVSASTAQLGVNVVNFGGSAGTFSGGRPEVNTTHIAGTAWASTTLFTLASHDPGATIGTSTLTQAQVSGGAYALNSSSFAFNSAFDFTSTQKTSLNSATPAVTVSDKTGFALTSAYDFAKGTVVMTESYGSDGSAPTPAQALFMMISMLFERNLSGTTLTTKKLDGTTTAMTFTIDSNSAPTTQTRTG